MRTLLKSLEMLWIVTLNNGETIYSDYSNPHDLLPPWTRLVDYCKDNDLFPVKVETLMLGAPKVVMAENHEGLDGLLILRGSSKDFLINTGEGTSYKQLIVGVLSDEDDFIDITKFCWPYNKLETRPERRAVTPENVRLMLFKNGSEKRHRENVQIALNGESV